MKLTNEYPKQVDGKSPNRVSPVYLKYPSDWIAQYDMLLPDGVTCNSCEHIERCSTLFGQNKDSDTCQFYPSRACINTQTS